MAEAVIVHGPQGCGKTRNAEVMRRAFGCTSIVDDWLPLDPIQPGALHLTYAIPFQDELSHAMVVGFHQAMRWAEGRGEDG